jgi:hypothetical protein
MGGWNDDGAGGWRGDDGGMMEWGGDGMESGEDVCVSALAAPFSVRFRVSPRGGAESGFETRRKNRLTVKKEKKKKKGEDLPLKKKKTKEDLPLKKKK